MAVNALGFLDSICITVFMSLCDIVGISDRLADHDSLSKLHNAIFKVNNFLESLPSFWIMRSQRSRRRDKGLWLAAAHRSSDRSTAWPFRIDECRLGECA